MRWEVARHLHVELLIVSNIAALCVCVVCVGGVCVGGWVSGWCAKEGKRTDSLHYIQV